MNFHQHPITYVSDVTLKIEDLNRAVAFYTEVVGLKVHHQTDKTAALTADGSSVLVTLEQPDHVVPKEKNRTGLYHFALLVPKRSDLTEVVQHFVNKEVSFLAEDHLVSEALYIWDPDGNGIEIYADRDPSQWDWKNGEVAMTSDPIKTTDLLPKGEPKPWKGLPAGTIMGHIHLHVARIEAAERFYTKGLGFELVNRHNEQTIFVSDGKYHHHVALNTWQGIGAHASSPESVGLQSFSVVFPDEETRDKRLVQLEDVGASVKEENGEYVTEDPSGNQIILRHE
ncbi:VOC family protein [Alteribacillus iranensis]|uniref:Catechol 2,3-dioxygenase n=1 Tax=Alteribacillus iranensis TaxID=930128 RepID=A0A1I2DI14_9BACI|nr:VOC family protein [Alteribacillus iranensis]SFE80156.1 catechol 2,3-dioxygenase [Alteribacillus iranensis]